MNNLPKISLKAARVNAQLSQEKAAKLLNISRATLQSYESGKTVPDWSTVQAMEGLYAYPADHLFFYNKNSL